LIFHSHRHQHRGLKELAGLSARSGRFRGHCNAVCHTTGKRVRDLAIKLNKLQR
jgi:hypothetical protein